MQLTHADFPQTLEKLRKKVAFFKKAASQSDLTKEQIEWINKNSVMFSQTLASLQPKKDNGSSNQESATIIAQDLINNMRKVKRKVVGWIKFKSTDIDVFRNHSKSEKWIPLMNYLSPPPKFSDIQNSDLADINFPCMSYTNQEMCQFAERIFKEQNVLTEFKMTPEKLEKIVANVCGGYNVPAYHNFTHGFNVFQMFYCMVKKTELGTVLDGTEKFAALLAALGHDLNHRGYNNAYEAKLQTKTALVYFDTAILESMHASLLIKILKDPEIGFFDLLPDMAKRNQFRDLVTAIILATDMSKHFKLLKKFTECVNATLEYRKTKGSDTPVDSLLEEKAFIMDRPHDKRRILKNIIHACDIGNPCQKFENYMYWSTLVSQEFDTQARSEQKRGVDVMPNFQYKNLQSFYGGQIFFSKVLVLPLWEQINVLFKGSEETVENLKMNLKRLEEEKVQAAEE